MPSRDDVGTDFVSIAVADSTRIHTQLLADALGNDRGLQVVAAASNSEELLDSITRVPIDVVIVSHNLDNKPGRGAQVLHEIRALRPRIKGVILLDDPKSQEVLDCFRSGARGIFSKQERIESLCKCIRSVYDGQVWARSSDLDHALEALVNSPLVRTTNHQGLELLSERERQVVQHLAAGLTNREIAQALKLSAHTVKNYLFRIFDKLGVSNRTELLYLTMNHAGFRVQNGNGDNAFTAAVKAAESGDLTAQLGLAEHFCQPGTHDGKANAHDAASDPVSSYMWYLLAEKTAAPLMQRIEEGKKAAVLRLSAQQRAEAENKAAVFLEQAKKHPGFATTRGEMPPDRVNASGAVRT
jgi:DNA-binding NarL/FixJ family response regulator